MDIDQSIHNWQLWHWTLMGLKLSRCLSFEGVYSGPQGKGQPTGWGDWKDGQKPRISPKIDILDAERTELAWRGLDHIPKLLLKYHYIVRRSKLPTCRKLHIRPHEYELRVMLAKLDLKKELDRNNALAHKLYSHFERVA